MWSLVNGFSYAYTLVSQFYHLGVLITGNTDTEMEFDADPGSEPDLWLARPTLDAVETTVETTGEMTGYTEIGVLVILGLGAAWFLWSRMSPGDAPIPAPNPIPGPGPAPIPDHLVAQIEEMDFAPVGEVPTYYEKGSPDGSLVEPLKVRSVLEDFMLQDSLDQWVELYTGSVTVVFVLLGIVIIRKYDWKTSLFLCIQLLITKGLIGAVILVSKNYLRGGLLSMAPALGQLSLVTEEHVMCLFVFLGIGAFISFIMVTWRIIAVWLSEGEDKIDWVYWAGAYTLIYLIGGLTLLFLALFRQV